jgi:phosphatidylinositol alpha-1,6-mannosyltransferase
LVFEVNKISRLVLVTEGLDGQDGGIQRVTRSVREALRNESILSEIWSANDSHGLTSKKNDSLSIRYFERNYLKMGLSSLFSSLKLTREGKIVCWHLGLSPIAAVLSFRTGAPYHIFLHGIEAWRDFSPRLQFALKRASLFCANSHYTLERFRREHPEFSKVPGKILPLGLNSELLEGFQRPVIDIGLEHPFFLTVTRFVESYKGEETLFRAFAEFSKDHPEYRLICVGEGPTRKGWEDKANSFGLAQKIQFLGHVPDSILAGLYQKCFAFTLLSEGEGFGIVYLEAMYCGKPCIATNADAAKEIVRDGVTGLVVEPQNIPATVDALKNLAENRPLTQKLGEEARKMVLANYMPQHFLGRLKEFMAV